MARRAQRAGDHRLALFSRSAAQPLPSRSRYATDHLDGCRPPAPARHASRRAVARHPRRTSAAGQAVMNHRFDLLCLGFLGTTAGSALLFGPGAISLGIPLALFIAILTDGVARPGSNVLYPTVTHGSREGRDIALTFDDGPDPET